MNFQKSRFNMVEQQVRPWQVSNERVLTTLLQLPRERFVPSDYLNLAYSDTDIPLAQGQHMLCPRIVGRALQALDLSGNEKVLEIGTGTGYVTACLSRLAQTVFSVEIQAPLFAQALKVLSSLNCRNVTLEQGDGVWGWENKGPYDAIVVTGAYPLGVPQKVFEQLNPNGGRLFAICGKAPAMQALVIERKTRTEYQTTTLFETVVAPLIHAPTSPQFHF